LRLVERLEVLARLLVPVAATVAVAAAYAGPRPFACAQSLALNLPVEGSATH